jgi:hypothetical protein
VELSVLLISTKYGIEEGSRMQPKEKQMGGQKGKSEKVDPGARADMTCVCSHHPLSLDLIRSQGRRGDPPPPVPHLGQFCEGMDDLCDDLQMEVKSKKLVSDSDGDRFLLLPLFDRTPVSRDIDC